MENHEMHKFSPTKPDKIFYHFFPFVEKWGSMKRVSCCAGGWLKWKKECEQSSLVNELNYLIACLNRVNFASNKVRQNPFSQHHCSKQKV